MAIENHLEAELSRYFELKSKEEMMDARIAVADQIDSENCDDEANNDKVLAEMVDLPDEQRRCRFRCALALVGEGCCETFSGTCEGTLLHQRRGTGGFGYDPLFQPDESPCTFAEISAEEKAKISHRARALAKLVDFLSGRVA